MKNRNEQPSTKQKAKNGMQNQNKPGGRPPGFALDSVRDHISDATKLDLRVPLDLVKCPCMEFSNLASLDKRIHKKRRLRFFFGAASYD